jgi:hypothetical protein
MILVFEGDSSLPEGAVERIDRKISELKVFEIVRAFARPLKGPRTEIRREIGGTNGL